MKQGIHPKYNTNVAVVCACGAKFTTGSTIESIDTEICKNCHPFYTGKQKLIDTTGLVDKFNKRREKFEAIKAQTSEKKPRKLRTKA